MDTLSIGVAYWVEHMARDTDKAASEHLEALRDIELERFADHVLGHRVRTPTWM